MIGDELAAALPRMRAMAESLMRDTVRVERVTGEVDELTGEAVRTVVYEGKAKLQNQNQYESRPESGGHTYVEQRSLVHFPVGSFQMENGDLCTFIESAAPFVAGQQFRLTGRAPYRTLETAYRVYADQIVG